MDWRLSNFDWNKARAFIVTVEEGSLSAAARALKTTQATLSRQVSALEDELGITLYERSGHNLVLTPSGAELAEFARSMAQAAERFSDAASSRRETAEGTICISASEFDAAIRLPPVIKKLRQEHPEIHIDIIVSDSVADLKRREADIALRWFEPTQNDLNANKIGVERLGFFASSAYLCDIGIQPNNVQELEQLSFVGFDTTVRLRNILKPTGLQLSASHFPLLCESYLVQRELVRAGLGVGLFPCDIGDMDSDLVRLCPTVKAICYDLWLVSHQDFVTNVNLKAVYNTMLQELKNYFDNAGTDND